MCLYCFDGEKVADRDIPVVKIMVESNGLFGMRVYRTPYMHERVSRRIIRGRRDYKAYGAEDVRKDSWFNSTTIKGGFIHTYGIGADKGRMWYALGYGERFVKFMCVIPAGCRYWSNDKTGEYASKSIRFCYEVPGNVFECSYL